MSDESADATYHVLDDGTKWPNCLSCGSENTAVVPATDEWECRDCGHQWHSDETPVDDGDGDAVGDKIEKMVRWIAQEDESELESLAEERDVL